MGQKEKNGIRDIVSAHEDQTRRLEPKSGAVNPRYLVLRTRFHDGGIVSVHKTVTGAARAVYRFRSGVECECGCVGIWDRLLQGEPPHADHVTNARALCRN